jgi:outer membrane beta-barrel protein
MRKLLAARTGAGIFLALVMGAARAEGPTAGPTAGTTADLSAAGPQVIAPEVERRDVKVAHIPSRDFEAGVFLGTYSTDNFGSNPVGGVRLGYHVSEDFFIESALAETRVSDQSFRQILPGGIFPTPRQWLRYYNISLGYNLLPGEIFLGRSRARVSAVYVIAGMGSTQFLQESHQTFNGGIGMRVFLRDWAAVQVDARDHVFSTDLLGTRRSTQNLEFTTGLTFFF